jgi:hypothetical protein
MTEIPAELVAAQREVDEAGADLKRLQDAEAGALKRYNAAVQRVNGERSKFLSRVTDQARELAPPAEEGR